MTEVCRACSGFGRVSVPVEAVARLVEASANPNDQEHIHGEDEITWADVMTLVREYQRLVRIEDAYTRSGLASSDNGK
jgi:hypothetical protein